MIDRFVEKPKEFVGNRINAGLYILNPEVIDLIEMKPTSIETETFPKLVNEKSLYTFDLEGFWMDVGQPKDFLAGTGLYLQSLSRRHPEKLSTGSNIVSNAIIDPTAKISPDAKIGPDVVIGPNCVIGSGVRIVRSVLLKNCVVKENSLIKDTIVGWDSTIGRWCRLEGCAVLGHDVAVKDEVYVNGAKVLPHKSISANVPSEAIIM